MARTYTKPGSTVTVEPEPGRVIVVTREGCHAPDVCCCPADDPAGAAEGIGRGLLDEGYSLAA